MIECILITGNVKKKEKVNLMSTKDSIVNVLYNICRIFPIKKNRIVFSSFDNKQYGGNPRVISEYLEQNSNLELIWVIDKNVKVELPGNVKRVNSHSIKKIYYYATAKVWVDSHHFYNRKKRKNQYLVQTWHASNPIKKIEGDCLEYFKPSHIRQVRHCSNMTDYQLTDSDFGREVLKRGMWYSGPILQVGMPINDRLVASNPDDILETKKKLGLSLTNRFVLYAPTCRQHDEDENNTILDYDRLIANLKEKFGGNWTVLYRGHPISNPNKDELLKNKYVLDVSQVQQAADLLLIADIVITDYSSIIIDFLATSRPGFLFTYDYADYKGKRDFYFDLHELPFDMTQNNNELAEAITEFDVNIYYDKVQRFKKKINYTETGNATESISRIIMMMTED